MSMNLPRPELWYRRNQQVTEALGAARTDVVKTYSSLQQAVFEIGFATATFYSHKKAIGVLSGISPEGSSIWPLLSKEGFAVQNFSQRKSWPDIEAWLQQLKPETSLVMMSEDHPVTGEVFTELNDKITAHLTAKKLFSIRISHFAWPQVLAPFLSGGTNALPQKLGGWTSFICGLSQNRAFALLGSRVKVPNLVVPLEPLDPEAFTDWTREIHARLGKSSTSPPATSLHPVPSRWPEGFRDWLPAGTSAESSPVRLLTHPERQAEAVWQKLGRPQGLEPLNACFSPDVDWSWWEGMPEPQDFRGLLRWDRHFPFPEIESFNRCLRDMDAGLR